MTRRPIPPPRHTRGALLWGLLGVTLLAAGAMALDAMLTRESGVWADRAGASVVIGAGAAIAAVAIAYALRFALGWGKDSDADDRP